MPKQHKDKYKHYKFTCALICLGFIVLLFGCSKKKDIPTLPDAHPVIWMDKDSDDFHGKIVSSNGDVETCRECHGETLDGGKVEVSCITCHALLTDLCIRCHGGIDSNTGAPPIGLRGETNFDELAVGAHTSHLEAGHLSKPISCSECHLVPVMLMSDGHLGIDSIAEIIWGELAGEQSIWNRETSTCTNTYCHGEFSGGNEINAPVWTGTDHAICGSCHDNGSEPAGLGWRHKFHVEEAKLKCGDCHFSTVDTLGNITGLNLHINGIIDTLTRDIEVCQACHGSTGQPCTICHGGADNLSGAPPEGLHGEVFTNQIAVGAHSKHIEPGLLGAVVNCSECHMVPDSVFAENHLGADSIAEIIWGDLTGNQAIWNHNSAQCSNTYCHGNFEGGNESNSPIWIENNQAQCGSCHDIGDNPSDLLWKHEYHINSANLQCADCHYSVVDQSLSITAPEMHVNGILDTLTRDVQVCNTCHGSGSQSCTICHGGIDNQTGAPPLGLHGEINTSQLSVGAHSSHVQSGIIAESVNCSECHIVPDSIFADGHLGTDSIAEINWGTLAGLSSLWDRSTVQCSNTYCHGNFTGGSGSNTPVWTGTAQAECGSCHDVGTSPANLLWKHEYHISEAGLSCGDCHAAVVDLDLNITGRALHVNGTIDTLTRDVQVCNNCHGSGPVACTLCHGGTDNQTGAPPLGLRDETSSAQLAVGAHTVHMEGGVISGAYECSECHLVPDSLLVLGHLGADSIAEMSWGTLAGQASLWNRISGECSNTYCHGNFTAGITDNTPVWTATNQAECGSCHDVGSSPADLGWKHEYHVGTAGLSCGECHATVFDTLLNVVNAELHVNGILDTLTRDIAVCNDCHGSGNESCTLCHGGIDNSSGAPPKGLHGETQTSQLAVGAHTPHIQSGSLARAVQCSECHIVPDSLFANGHLGTDSIAEINWGSLAGLSSSWNRSTEECSNTYCHGNFSAGNQSNTPIWTGSNQSECGSCHDLGTNPADLGWKHNYHVGVADLSCGECHASMVDTLLNITNPNLHVNGISDTLTRDVTVCNVCHGPGSQSCTLCHGGTDNSSGAPPVGLHGETLTTQRVVGAHTAHLEEGSYAIAFDCTECHILPDSLFASGHLGADSIAELSWGPLAGNLSIWNRTSSTCSNVYCHGRFSGGYATNTPIWTGSNQANCGSCHDDGSDPESLSGRHKKHIVDENIPCYRCHSTTVNAAETIIGKTVHVDGEKTVSLSGPGTYSNGNCSGLGAGCHGFENWYDDK